MKLKYTAQDEARIMEIMGDFCWHGNRKYMATMGFYYGSLDDSRLITAEQRFQILGESACEDVSEWKDAVIAARFQDSYLRALRAGDRAMIMAELIFHAERSGFDHHIVNCDSSRDACLSRIRAHPDYKLKLDEKAETSRLVARYAHQVSPSEKNQRRMNLAPEDFMTAPFAWLEKGKSGPQRIIDLFGIRDTMGPEFYDSVYVIDSAKGGMMSFGGLLQDEEPKVREFIEFLK